MKHIFNYIFAAAIALVFTVSCAKEMISSPETGKFVPMTLTASQDTKTSLYNDGVRFSSSDRLYVYGQSGSGITGVQFTPDGQGRKESYNFTSTSWPEGYTPIYAVATTSTSEDQSCTSAGVIKMLVDNENQAIDWSDSYASNTVGHVGAVSDGSTTLKNVCGLLKFKLSRTDIKKIIVSGTGGEYLGGWVTVDYSKMCSTAVNDSIEFFTTGTDAVKKLTITVGSKLDNKTRTSTCLPSADTTLYISILPGNYSGLKFTLINSANEIATRTLSNITVKRGQIRRLGGATTSLDNGLTFAAPELPETFTLILDKKQAAGKKAWPFNEAIVAKESQTDAGETYTYTYTDSETGSTFGLPFVVCNTAGTPAAGYAYTYCFDFKTNGDYIKFPAIEGRHISSILICHRNTGTKKIKLGTTVGGSDLLAAQAISSSPAVSYVFGGTTDNTAAYLTMASSGVYLDTLSVTYTSDIVLDCTNAANFHCVGKAQADTVLITRKQDKTYSEENFNFWLNAYPNAKFNGVVRNWGGYLSAKTGARVALPKLDEYYLKTVQITDRYNTPGDGNKGVYVLNTSSDIIASANVDKGDSATLDLSSYRYSRTVYMKSDAEFAFKFTLTYSKL